MAQAQHTIVVAGLGRCGSSLAMQMLAVGGVPCAGDWPAFEHEAFRYQARQWDLDRWRGHAVKVLDPQRNGGLNGNVRVIFMRRDPEQQAKSMAKFSRETLGLAYDRAGRRKLEASLRSDTARCLQLLIDKPLLVVDFEELITHPKYVAEVMAGFVDVPMHSGAAARAVLPRGMDCRADLQIELTLLQARVGPGKVEHNHVGELPAHEH